MKSTIIFVLAFALPILSHPVGEAAGPAISLPKRQHTIGLNMANFNCPYSTIKGDAKGQAYQHTQVTENIDCGSGDCAVSKLKQHTFGVSVGAEITSPIWGLGASVSEEWTSGETYECGGDEDDGFVCVWLKTAYTIYDVGTSDGCYNDDTVEARFPNKNNAGGNYYCVRGERYCRDLDSMYWEDDI